MSEHVARRLCFVAATENMTVKVCSYCGGAGERCEMWSSFESEAEAAIGAVRDFAMLTMRRKPRLSDFPTPQHSGG